MKKNLLLLLCIVSTCFTTQSIYKMYNSGLDQDTDHTLYKDNRATIYKKIFSGFRKRAKNSPSYGHWPDIFHPKSNIEQAIIQLLDTHYTKHAIAHYLADAVSTVLHHADRHNFIVAHSIERHLQTAINGLPHAVTPQEFTFHLATIGHLVNDVQLHSTKKRKKEKTFLQQSSKALVRAVSKYCEYLAPTENELSLIADTARYICDVTVGTDYLSAAVRKQRIDQFWHILDALSLKRLSKLTIEQWIDNSCYLAARATYGLGASATLSVLKNVKKVSSTLAGAARAFAQHFIQAFDQIIGANPAIITSQVVVVWKASPTVVDEARQAIFAFNGMKNKQSDKKLPDVIDSAQKVMEKEKELKVKTVNDLINESKPGEKTAGPTTQYERHGGYSKALEDFESLKPKDIRDISNEMGAKKVGTLENGSKVVVRDHSKGLEIKGPPTLEIQIAGKYTKIKFRYR